MVLRDLLCVFDSSRQHSQSRLEPGKGCRKSDCMERLDTAQKGLVGSGRSSTFFKSTIFESQVLMIFFIILTEGIGNDHF